jgi:hypothetical protein
VLHSVARLQLGKDQIIAEFKKSKIAEYFPHIAINVGSTGGRASSGPADGNGMPTRHYITPPCK